MAALLKRFKRTNSDPIDGVAPSPPISSSGSREAKEVTEKDVGLSTAQDYSEEEANRKLNLFERAHRWDPNLDDSQRHEIDDAVNTRDPNAEGTVYDELFENSPYPEVSQTASPTHLTPQINSRSVCLS